MTSAALHGHLGGVVEDGVDVGPRRGRLARRPARSSEGACAAGSSAGAAGADPGASSRRGAPVGRTGGHLVTALGRTRPGPERSTAGAPARRRRRREARRAACSARAPERTHSRASRTAAPAGCERPQRQHAHRGERDDDEELGEGREEQQAHAPGGWGAPGRRPGRRAQVGRGGTAGGRRRRHGAGGCRRRPATGRIRRRARRTPTSAGLGRRRRA